MTNENETIQKTSIAIKKNTLKTLKKIAIDKDITQNQLITEFIEAGISRNKENAKY